MRNRNNNEFAAVPLRGAGRSQGERSGREAGHVGIGELAK